MKVPVSAKENNGDVSKEDGYIKLDNGLIIQYGFAQRHGGQYLETFSFPRPFPHKVFSIAGSPTSGMDINLNWGVTVLSNSTFGVYTDNGGGHRFNWMAIGY